MKLLGSTTTSTVVLCSVLVQCIPRKRFWPGLKTANMCGGAFTANVEDAEKTELNTGTLLMRKVLTGLLMYFSKKRPRSLVHEWVRKLSDLSPSQFRLLMTGHPLANQHHLEVHHMQYLPIQTPLVFVFPQQDIRPKCGARMMEQKSIMQKSPPPPN